VCSNHVFNHETVRELLVARESILPHKKVM